MSQERPGLAPRFDASHLSELEDPYPEYERMRQAGPLCRGGPGQWLVPRYTEVAALLRDPRLSNEFPEAYHRFSAGDGPASRFFKRIMLDRDPPGHTRLRRLVSVAFSPSLIRGLTGRIQGIVDDLLAPALDGGQFDLVTDLAFPLPVLVLGELLGIPVEDRDQVRLHTLNLANGFSTLVSEENRRAADLSVGWLRAYVNELLAMRRRTGGDDLLSHMLAGEGGDDQTSDEIVDNAVFLVFAGFETTLNLIATGCAALLGHPDELRRLRRDRSLLPTAIEEFLRYDAPIHGRARIVREPIEIGGRSVRSGRVVVLLLASANHDERQFSDPDRLDIGRAPNAHLSFGGGVHYCLGAPLARLEGAITVGGLLDKFRSIEPAGPLERQRSQSRLRTYMSIPVTVRPA
jgi:cytochrome P450